ncbi:MAG: hypothetical protein Q4G42_07680 [Neisseria sp.]|nr:hypothetical protein [Neisseria sp.]
MKQLEISSNTMVRMMAVGQVLGIKPRFYPEAGEFACHGVFWAVI